MDEPGRLRPADLARLGEAARRQIGAEAEARAAQPKRGHAGWREVGGQRFYARSVWEANFALYLEWERERGLILGWKHEPTTFWFEGVRRGVTSYKPDFAVVGLDGATHFVEVKGHMDPKSKTKLKRMAQYHPGIGIKLVTAVEYRRLSAQVRGVIAGWE